MSELTVQISEEHLQKLKKLSQPWSTTPEQFLQSTIEQWLDQPQPDFRAAADYVLNKNAELYRCQS